MKAELQFNIEDREDKMALNRCIKAEDMAIALFEISSNHKRRVEAIAEAWENREHEVSWNRVLDLAYTLIADELIEQGIDLDELTE